MIQTNHDDELLPVRSFLAPGTACGQLKVAVWRLSHYFERDAIVNTTRSGRTMLCAVLAILLLVVHVHAQEDFLDDFEDGPVEDGIPVRWLPSDRGVMEVVGGDYLWTPDAGNVYADVSGSRYTDVSAHTQLRLSDSIGVGTMISARAMGYFGTITPTGELGIWCAACWDGGNLDSGYLSPPVGTGLDPTANDTHLQFDLFGNELTLRAWSDDDPSTVFEIVEYDGSASSGAIGLFHNPGGSNTSVAFRFFEAKPLLPLQAGDADQDYDFDQFDLIQVLAAGKYLTGEPATWGEGDWNGAPHGYAGRPPLGDGAFDQLDIVAALDDGLYMAGAPANYVGGRRTIGETDLLGARKNFVTGPSGEVTPGLAQEWFQVGGNPGNKAGVDDVFSNQNPVVPPFKASHGETWWTGYDVVDPTVLEGLVSYPPEVQPELNDTNNDNYVVRLMGEILIPESGPYRFADGIDDYAYWAIDIDKSGVAGDSLDEILIDDNVATNELRVENNGGQGYAAVDIEVAEGGEWLAVEFNMAEGPMDDAGVVYWDYNPDAPEGQRLGGADGFPEFSEAPILDDLDAAAMYIPNTHLRSESPGKLISADLVATLGDDKAWEFDVDGDTDTADSLAVPNSDPNVFTSVLDLNGAELRIVGTGSLQDGDTFKIIDADQITGDFTITSADPSMAWAFDPGTGEITLGSDQDGLAALAGPGLVPIPVPEPSTFVLLGLAAMMLIRRRR